MHPKGICFAAHHGFRPSSESALTCTILNSKILEIARYSCGFAASVLSALEKGVSCSTAEIKVNFIRPITTDTGILRCEARPIHIGKRLATAEGKLKDKNDNLYAHAVSTCFIFKAGKE